MGGRASKRGNHGGASGEWDQAVSLPAVLRYSTSHRVSRHYVLETLFDDE